MRPRTDHSQPPKRRRFENGATTSSVPSSHNQPFINGNALMPRHTATATQHSNVPPPNQTLFNHRTRNGQAAQCIPVLQSNPANPSQVFPSQALTSHIANGQHPAQSHNHFPCSPSQTQPNLQNFHMPFGAPSAPLTTTSTTLQPQPWPMGPQQQHQPPTSTDFTASSDMFDEFFAPAGTNPAAKSTHANPQGTSFPPLNGPSVSNDMPFPNVLPPLAPGAAPPLGGVDPFSGFTAFDATFRSTPQITPSFMNVSSAPANGVSTGFPLLGSSAPTPPPRLSVSARPTNGTAPARSILLPRTSSSQFNAPSILPPRPGITPSGNRIIASRGPVSLRMMPHVKKALDSFRDGSPIIVALAQTVAQASSVNISTDAQRNGILDFTGFPANPEQANPVPNIGWLLSLSKNDLDFLAWIFGVSKHGRKDEVARRIVSSLRAPLRLRNQNPGKRPGPSSRADMRSTTLGGLATPIRTKPQTFHTSSTRGNMPNLGPSAVLTRGDNILNNLQRQIVPAGARGTTAYSSPPSPRMSGHHSRSKQMQNLCSEVLHGYNFDVGENPFNKPMRAPLGSEPYVIFSSMQLSRGNSDPTLNFATPVPIEKNGCPEVEGGDVQVHIRCLRVEMEKPKAEWKQAWPFPATCRVNGHSVTLSQAQRYTNGKLAGRDAATNITPFLRKYKKSGKEEMNKVMLRRQTSTASASVGQFVFFAQEILVLSHETMTKSVFEASEKYWVEYRANLEKKGSIVPSTPKFEMARQGVMQFLTDPDGLTVSSMKVSLRCPLALTRIAIPVKGRRCQHVQCFDLENFLEYSRRSSKFDCPVCNKSTADPAMLVISPYIEHALETFKDCDEVEINQDGSMVEVERKRTGVASDDEDDRGVKAEPRKVTSRCNGVGGGSVSEVVDLTLDSDDDDDHQDAGGARSSAVRRTTDATTARIGGGNTTTETPPGLQGTHQGDDTSPAEQDMFSFRADFYWREPQARDEFENGTTRMLQSHTEHARENWTTDVIAIDSD